jgi:alpha-galactosidase
MAIIVITVLLILIPTTLGNNNGLGLTPPMGWNTWCTEGSCGRDFCNAQEVMAVADAMTTNGMKDVGFQYINLDGMGN